MKNILRAPRHPADEKFIKHHLGQAIAEIEIGHGQRLFRIGLEEYDNLSEAAKVIVASLNDSIAGLDTRKVDKDLNATRSRDEMKTLVDKVVKEIEGDFLKKLHEVFLPDGDFKTVTFIDSEWYREDHEKKAAADLKSRFIQASGDPFHFLLLVKHRPEILLQSLDSVSEILAEPILSVAPYRDPVEIEKERLDRIAQTRVYLEENLASARKLVKK